MKNAMLFLLVFILFGCDSGDNTFLPTSDGLKGKWIEIGTRTDTLTFETWDGMEVMKLGRAKEVRNGFLVPKAGAGLYEYKLEDGRIALYWMLSSNSNFRHYNFVQGPDTLRIENFYSSPSGALLKFGRLR